MDREFHDVVANVTLKTQSTRANLSSNEEDLAVQLGKIQKWYTDFTSWVWEIPTIRIARYSEFTNGNGIDDVSYDDINNELVFQRGNFAYASHDHNKLEFNRYDLASEWGHITSPHADVPYWGLDRLLTPTFAPENQADQIPEMVGIHLSTQYGKGLPWLRSEIMFYRASAATYGNRLLYRSSTLDDTYDNDQFETRWKAPITVDDISLKSTDHSLAITKQSNQIKYYGPSTMEGILSPEPSSISINTSMTIGHATEVTAQQTAGLYKVAYDANGHITSTTAVAKADITALGIPGSDTDTKVTQTAISDVSTWTNYRPLVISNASYTNSSFTPSTTTAGTYIASNMFCQPSTGVIWATGRGLKPFAVQTNSEAKKQAVTLETLMAWLITNKYIPSGVYAHIVLTTTWAYADNDYLLFTENGNNYQIFLAGCTMEFAGYATAYNTGVFRLVIHTAPHKASGVTPESGYTLLDAAQVIEYWCNGSAYSPQWKIYATRADLGSVGSTVCPVYFSNGQPVAVTQPTSGAWWSSVPKIDANGVLEAGKYIDFHATATSTNNYDYRIYSSLSSAVFQASNASGTQIMLASPGYSSIRFETSATGKACSSAIIQAYPLTTSGQVMLIQSGGNTVIGGGEFASNAYTRKDSTGTDAVGYDNLATTENEDLYLGADTDVHIISNGQNIGTYSNTDHKEWLFAANGVLTSPDYIKISKNSAGLMLTDKNNVEFGGVWYNGSNFWLGATQTNTHHHVGGTYISTGYDSTNSVGNSTVKIVVPNAANNGGTTYDLIHTGNKSLLNDTYLPLAGGTMTTGVTVTIPRAGGGGARITDQGLQIQVANSVGFARAIQLYRGDWSTKLGSIGFYGSGSATANDVEYFMGDDYSNPWYSFKKTQFTVKGETNFKINDSNDTGWSLVYKSSLLSMDGQVISCYPSSSQYGCGVIIGESSGGLTIIGGGEAARSLKNTIMDASTTPYSSAMTYDSENLIMAADTSLYFVSGANGLSTSAHTDWTDLKTVVFDNSGYFRPTVNNKGYVGTASYKWAAMYATTFYGQLSGTIASSTTATTQALSDSSTKLATTRFTWDLFNKSGVFYNSSTDSTTAEANPWGVVASVVVKATGNTYISSTFLITNVYQNHTGTGMFQIRATIKGSAGTLDASKLKWILMDENVNDSTVVVTYTTDTTSTEKSVTLQIWAKCPNRYDAMHVHPIYEGTLSAQTHNEFWTYSSITSGSATYSGTLITPLFRGMQHPQRLLYESTSASTATYLECTIGTLTPNADSALFNAWRLIYVTIQDMSFGSGSNPMSINFMVPLGFLANPTNESGTAITHDFYVGEGYNPSNTSAPTTRILVQKTADNKIKFTHGSGNRIGKIRIYGIY